MGPQCRRRASPPPCWRPAPRSSPPRSRTWPGPTRWWTPSPGSLSPRGGTAMGGGPMVWRSMPDGTDHRVHRLIDSISPAAGTGAGEVTDRHNTLTPPNLSFAKAVKEGAGAGSSPRVVPGFPLADHSAVCIKIRARTCRRTPLCLFCHLRSDIAEWERFRHFRGCIPSRRSAGLSPTPVQSADQLQGDSIVPRRRTLRRVFPLQNFPFSAGEEKGERQGRRGRRLQASLFGI